MIVAALMLLSIVPMSSAALNTTSPNQNSAVTSGSFQNITSQIDGLPSIPGAWASLTVSGDGGFITVGGNGVVFYNGTIATPLNNNISQAGYLTGAAYYDHYFLLVGTEYLPNPAPLMYKFYPSNGTVVNVSSAFASTPIGHGILSQDVYCNGLFLITASSKNAQLNQIPYTTLYSYNPITGSVQNITPNLLNTANPHVSNVEEYVSPSGTFMLASGNNYSGNTYLYLYNESSSVLTNLSYLLPSDFSVHTSFLPGMNMAWYKGSLIIGGSQEGLLSMFAINLTTSSAATFPGISSYIGSIDSLTVGNGSLFIGGVSDSFESGAIVNSPILLTLPNINISMFDNPIVDMSSAIPSNFHMISSMAYSNNSFFITGGEMYYADFGVFNFKDYKYSLVTFYTSNNEPQIPFQIIINSTIYQSFNNTIVVALSYGNYTYSAKALNDSYDAYGGTFSISSSLPLGIFVKITLNSSISSNVPPYVVGSSALNYADSLALNFSAALYLYGYSTSGISQASQFANGSYALGVGMNGYNDTGMAITTSPVNSYKSGANSHYAISGVGVSGFSSYHTYYKVNTPPIQPSTEVSLTFNVTSNSLVVFMGMSAGAYYILLGNITGMKVDSILNQQGDVGLAIEQAYLNPGTYTVTEYITNGDGGSNTRSEILSASVFTDFASTINSFKVNSSKSLVLANGSQQYFYTASTPAVSITNVSWIPDFQMRVNNNSMGFNGTILSIGHQNSNVGFYNSSSVNYEISGVGVSGFSTYSIFNGSFRSFNSVQSFNLGFSVTSSALVLIMIAGGGVGSINITGGTQSLSKLYDTTLSERGSQVNASAAAYAGNFVAGTYAITIASTMNQITNDGTGGVLGAVAYVFYPVNADYSQLHLKFNPPDSRVYVNGSPISLSSSGQATLSVLPGNYYVNATLSGYHSFSNLFTVNSNRAYFVNVTLTPLLRYGYLTGTVYPGNATVSVGGIIIPVHDGRYTESLSPGTYYVSASSFGYFSQFYSINITENGIAYLNVSLMKTLNSYTLSGYVNPAGASVVVGEYIAYVNSSGFYKISLPSGTYTISLSAIGYYSQTMNITLNQNMEDENFVLVKEPSPTSSESTSNVSAAGFNVTISGLAIGNGTVSLKYTASVNGTLTVTIPYSEISNVTVSELLSSKIYINGIQYKNYTVAISSIDGSYDVILTVKNLSGDPTLYWLYSPSASIPAPLKSSSSTLPFSLQLLGMLAIAILAVAVVVTFAMRKKK